jgi:hypothetical protein
VELLISSIFDGTFSDLATGILIHDIGSLKDFEPVTVETLTGVKMFLMRLTMT